MKALAAALVEAQKEMPAVQPDKTNPHFGNAFVSLDHLISKTLPVLNKHGLAITQSPVMVDGYGPGLTTTVLHGASGESITTTMPLHLAKPDMQGLGAAITYARRFAWASVLGICGEDDDDGNSASAPTTVGATPVSAPAQGSTANQSAGGGRAAGERAVPTAPLAAPSSFTPPASATKAAAQLVWKYGAHAGKTLEETPLEFVVNYAETGKPGFMVDKCREFLAEHGAISGDPDEGIPFDRTIDGLGN